MFSLLRLLFATLKSGVFKRTVVYTFSSVFAGLVGFLLLPILTRYLSQYDYGIIETFIVVVACLTGIIGVGSNTLLARKYFSLDSKEKKLYIANILEVIFINVLFVLVVFLIFSGFLSRLTKLSSPLLLLVVLVSLESMVITILLTLFQLERKALKYAIFSNSKLLVEIGLSLFLILVVGLRWEGRIAGIVFSSLLFLIITILIFRKGKIKFTSSPIYFRELYFLGAPLIIAHMSGWANNMIDKLMINNLISVEATGLYSVGYKFGMIIMVFGGAFGMAWMSYFYEKIGRNDLVDNLRIVKTTYIYIIGLTIFSLIFGFFGKYLLYFMVDKNFYGAAQFIFLISMAYCFDGIWSMFGGYLICEGKTKVYAGIVFVAAAVNIILNYILLQRIGLMGAAWATFISFALGAILVIILGNKSHPMPWFSPKLLESIKDRKY